MIKKTSLKEEIQKLDHWINWENNYKNYVPQFISEASKGNDWETWEKEIFIEFFEKAREQCVSSLQQGYFTNKEKENIKKNWNKIAPLLKNLSSNQEVPNFELYQEIQNVIRSYTDVNRKAATYRLIASLQPQSLCTIVNESKLKKLVDYLNLNIAGANISKHGNWFFISNNILTFFKTKLNENDAYKLMTFPWELYEHYTSAGNKNVIKENNNMEAELTSQFVELLEYKKQIIFQGPPGTGKTREAKLIAREILNLENLKDLEDTEQFKLIQFHPSYTYEDFVRGIVTESKGDKIEYKNVNKVLGEFSEKAFKNYKSSVENSIATNIDVWIDDKFQDFKNNIQARLPEEETLLTGDISIFEVSDDHFKYAKKWQTPGYLKFSEFKVLIKAIIQKEIDLVSSASKLDKNKFLHAHYRYTYYNALLNKFFSEYNYEVKEDKVKLKYFVLIIDEINRANLSSVLGELIYALEYRGEAVESMYAVGNDNKLILPPNLFIIGTMNTADRSVGHIDYAIRRRFAFVDVLPKDLSSESDVLFMKNEFQAVTSLFVNNYDASFDYNEDPSKIDRSEYLTNDFEPKDVWLGHSYFLQKLPKDANEQTIENDPIAFKLRLKYEIKPILEEYIKDGILKESARDVINSL